MEKYRYLHTKQGFTFVARGQAYEVSTSHPGFARVKDAVMSGRSLNEVMEAYNIDAQRVKNLVAHVMDTQGLAGGLSFEHGVIYKDGAPLRNYAVDRLIELLDRGHDATALSRFVSKQQQNPDPVVIEHLYKFMEVGKIPLTDDGDFLVYKAVRADYLDIHSGTILNKVGCRPSMPREMVDNDRKNLCSSGLHVCSFSYLPQFVHANGHVMICKVNPADVVSIPEEYANNKMRVWTYEVVGEVTSYYGKERRELTEEDNVLARAPRATARWVVWYRDPGSSIDNEYDGFYTKEEAVMQANALVMDDENPVERAWVTDAETGQQVHQVG